MRKTAVVGFALTAALTVLTAGCSDSGGSSTPATASSTASTTPVPAGDQDGEEQAVIDAYLAAIDAFYLAANPPDPDHPALAATHGGELLNSVREALSGLANDGHAIRRGPTTRYHPVVVRLSATTAVVSDCGTDGDVRFDVATRQAIDDSVVVGQSTAQLVLRKGQWITVAVEFKEGPCDGAS